MADDVNVIVEPPLPEIVVIVEPPSPEVVVVVEPSSPEISVVLSEVALAGPPGIPGPPGESPDDDGPSFVLLYENAKV